MNRLFLSITLTVVATASLIWSQCSPATNSANKEIGVLVLAHGSRDTTWNNSVRDAVAPLRDDYSVEIAYGMANPYNMQPAIDSLEAKEVDQIVVVPLFVSSHSPIHRQNQYLLGLRDSLADAPMQPMAHEMTPEMMEKMEHQNHDGHEDAIKPLQIRSDIRMATPLDDHPLVADILMDRIASVSDDPAQETILLVAHGPVKDSDNDQWLATSDRLAEQIRKLREEQGLEPLKEIISLTVRDDAGDDVYEQAKMEFRQLVEKADAEGEAIVIPLLLSKGGVERRYLTRLEGLNYTWGGEALLPHENITKFIRESVKTAVK